MKRLPRGVPMQVYGSIVPGAAAIARLLPQQANEAKRGKSRALSKEARERYRKIQWYEEHGRRVRLTCRHFGISSSTFYKWLRRYQSGGGPAGLGGRSARPHRGRRERGEAALVGPRARPGGTAAKRTPPTLGQGQADANAASGGLGVLNLQSGPHHRRP